MPWTDDEVKRLCVAIRLSGQRAPWVDRLADKLGLAGDALEAVIVRAFDGGEVEPWEHEGDRLTLTALSAERLGVGLTDDGERWMRLAKVGRTPRVKLPSGTITEADLSAHDETNDWVGYLSPLQRVTDDQPSAHENVIDREDAERLGRRYSGRGRPPIGLDVPMPKVLLGERLQWPVEGRPCQSCRGRLRPWEYCLVCDAFGLEHLLPKVSAIRAQPAKARKVVPGQFGRYAPPAPVKARRGA